MGSTTYLNSNDSILTLSTEIRSIIRSIVRDLDPTNELTFLRMKSIKHEVRFGIQSLGVFYYDKLCSLNDDGCLSLGVILKAKRFPQKTNKVTQSHSSR